MKNFTNLIMNKFSVWAIALIIVIGAMSACSSATKTNADDKGSAGGAEQSNSAANDKAVAENKTAENKAANESATKMQTDGLPELKKGEDYKTSVREKMLKAGWKTARSEQADWCGSAETVCDAFDEYEAHIGKNLTSFRWQKGSKFVEILTTGNDPYAYDSYEVEKNSMTIAQNERWNEFWTKFKSAVNKKDAAALKPLMAEYITGGGDDSMTSQQWLDSIQQNDSWSYNQKSVNEGTKIEKCDVPCRTTKDGYLIFEYKNDYWQWTSLGGEGGE